MDSEQILKAIRLCIVGNEMTWDDFEKIFGSMSKAKQYDIADFIQDDLKIELVDEISPRYFVDVEELRKAIRPHVIDGMLTYDNFEKLFGFLPLKEQYSICYAIQDHLKIELVDETISAPDEEIPDEDVSDEVAPLINRKPNEIKIPNKLLIKLIQDGDKQARQDLCVKNRRLVEKFASKYEKIFDSQLAFEDLVQEGTIGILKAAEQFDFSKDTQFSTYATWWIKQTITRAIVNTGLTVKLPVHVVEKILRASRYERFFMIQGFDLRRRIELIAQEMQTTPEEVSHLFALRAAYMNIVSLDKPVDEEDGDSLLINFIEDSNTPDPAESVSFMILKEQLEEVLNALTPREKDVLKLRYGLEDGRERTLEEVGKIFNVTRERIRQIEAKALRKLRHPARSKKLRDFLD